MTYVRYIDGDDNTQKGSVHGKGLCIVYYIYAKALKHTMYTTHNVYNTQCIQHTEFKVIYQCTSHKCLGITPHLSDVPMYVLKTLNSEIVCVAHDPVASVCVVSQVCAWYHGIYYMQSQQ